MKSLYITSVSTYSGKTALALGLGLRLQAAGHKVGYLKPVSTQPYTAGGRVLDEDADFVRRTLGLETPPWELSPIIITTELLDEIMSGTLERDLLAEVKAACEKAGEDKDILIMEGGASMREGYVIGLNTLGVVEQLIFLLLTIAQGLTFVSFSVAILFAFFKKTEVIARSILDMWIELIIQTIVIALMQSLIVSFLLGAAATQNALVVLGVSLLCTVFILVLLWSGIKAVWNSFNRLFGAIGQATGGVFADTLGWNTAFVLPGVLFLVTGVLLQFFSWHSVFITFAVSALATLLLTVTIGSSKDPDPGRFDVVGSVTSVLAVTGVVKGESIITDATWEDLAASGADKALSACLTTGAFAIGVDLEKAPRELLEAFSRADLVLAKGMANFEALSDSGIRPMAHLLRSKCLPVSKAIGARKDRNVIKVLER